MNFLIIEFDKKEESISPRSVRIIDDEMSLKIIFLTYHIDVIEILTGDKHTTGEFIASIDQKCKITNNNKIISSETIYRDLEYIEKDTDMGIVQLATIQVSLN